MFIMNRPLLILALLLTGGLAPAAPEKPNVLFIAVDDLNDWIGCLGGHPQALTPNIDRLAARGTLFANAHCAAPACNPSRAAVFSGLMPDETGVWSNSSTSIGKARPDLKLLPESFAAAGYRTAGTGKMLHQSAKAIFGDYYSTGQRWSPLTKEAVRYTADELPSKGTDDPRQVAMHRGKSYVLPLNRMPSDRNPANDGGESFDWGPWELPDSEFGDTLITDWAIGKIEEAGDAPLFLGVGYYRPHIPLWAPKRFFDRFAADPGRLPITNPDDLDDLSETGKAWALEAFTAGSHSTVVEHGEWQAAIEAYLACTTYIDHEIGRLLDGLDASPYADNTVIVLWSDHGWHLGEKEHWGKWTGWERSTRVPLIIVPPKSASETFATAGSLCDQPVGLIDLYPTLAALCGVEPPANLAGESLVPLLRDPEQVTGRNLVTLFDKGNVSVRDRHWRYIRYGDGSEELYNLVTDPHEWHNVAGRTENRERLAAMRAVW